MNSCERLTKKGEPCARSKIAGSNYCGIHQKEPIILGKCLAIMKNGNKCTNNEKVLGCGYCGKHKNSIDNKDNSKEEKQDENSFICLKKNCKQNRLVDSSYCKEHNTGNIAVPYECSVCMEKLLNNNEVKLSCNHWFHKKCLQKCKKHECPLCRKKFNEQEKNMFATNVELIHYGFAFLSGLMEEIEFLDENISEKLMAEFCKSVLYDRKLLSEIKNVKSESLNYYLRQITKIKNNQVFTNTIDDLTENFH